MSDTLNINRSIINKPIVSNYLWFLVMSYSIVIILSNWFAGRLISLSGDFSTGAGALIFPLAFLLSDIITEVYGYKWARVAVWCGFLFNTIFLVLGQIVILLPSPDYAIQSNEMFDSVLQTSGRIVIASILAYLIAEPVNSYIMAKTKVWFNGKYMGVRFILSTTVASFIDSNIMGTVAFYGKMPLYELFIFNVTLCFVKVFIELIITPLSTSFTRRLKDIEGSDIYDIDTNFNIFSFDTKYSEKSNKFKK
ncbi:MULTISPECIES: queuosine precursor transporter [Vibrio]|uniref:Probable queuosine precursor transporter n=1 Tax=Vibrio neptunius TaxID=170651 RepID=A0ABS3A082_9VIBR|nr:MULTISPECIES: queuosine precursor transporter [Vibrio]KJY94197.1 membrane protein [Vibrio neptunius]MBN3491937.1 queuosine precursor transporter [Vibrio neptunius]MBN3514368.1 queuosine precursor transporter [Vibrio neptunius]MBN3548517.1 queuosine precursor transporter [Vibrio neptunius]MBN3571789.1 queuosine precursor transporter [Vibrio neptunius]